MCIERRDDAVDPSQRIDHHAHQLLVRDSRRAALLQNLHRVHRCVERILHLVCKARSECPGRCKAGLIGKLQAQAAHLQMGANARLQHFRMKRLRYELIGAGFIALERRFVFPTGGEQNHRNMTQRGVALDRTGQVQAAHPRHHHVGQHQVRPISVSRAQAPRSHSSLRRRCTYSLSTPTMKPRKSSSSSAIKMRGRRPRSSRTRSGGRRLCRNSLVAASMLREGSSVCRSSVRRPGCRSVCSCRRSITSVWK